MLRGRQIPLLIAQIHVRQVDSSTTKQRRQSAVGTRALAPSFGSSADSSVKHEQEADCVSNNYATAYYTESPSLRQISISMSESAWCSVSDVGVTFLCLREQKEKKEKRKKKQSQDCFSSADTVAAALAPNDPHKPLIACGDESGCLLAITGTELLFLWPCCNESATIKFASEETQAGAGV